jgi:hypothetical protein
MIALLLEWMLFEVGIVDVGALGKLVCVAGLQERGRSRKTAAPCQCCRFC